MSKGYDEDNVVDLTIEQFERAREHAFAIMRLRREMIEIANEMSGDLDYSPDYIETTPTQEKIDNLLQTLRDNPEHIILKTFGDIAEEIEGLFGQHFTDKR